MCGPALQVAALLRAHGIATSVVDPLWALPTSDALVDLVAQHELVVTIEDNLVVGGLGSHLELAMDAAGVEVPMRQFGVPQRYIEAASRDEILAEIGLTPQAITHRIIETLGALQAGEPLAVDSALN